MTDLERFLDILDVHERAVLEALHTLISSAVPDAEARPRYGWRAINYHAPGRGHFCALFPMHTEVQLVFMRGAELADPAGLLQGSQKHIRIIPVADERRLRRRAVTALLRAARQQAPAPRRRRALSGARGLFGQ